MCQCDPSGGMATLTTYERYLGNDTPEAITCGHYLRQCPMPVYRMRMDVDHGEAPYLDLDVDRLYDTLQDPGQMEPVMDPALEERFCRELVKQMEIHDAPQEQYERLGLEKYR